MRATLLLIISLAVSINAKAGNDIRELWIHMPDTMTAYIDSLTKREMINFYDNNVGFASANFFGSNTWIDTISNGYMSVNMSETMTMQIRVLTKTDSTQMICMVRTYSPNDAVTDGAENNAADGESDITFFTDNWQALDGTFGLPLCNDEDSLLSQLTYCPDTMTQKRYSELKAMIDPVMLVARLSADDETITLTLSTPLLRKDDSDDAKSIIASRKLKWDGSAFK